MQGWARGAVLAAALALAGCATPGAGRSPAIAQAPNIILILADDMAWHDAGAYGGQDVPTPAIDRLAREGMTFTRAFQSTAVCAVTRQQLYTGLDPMRSGAYPQHSWVKPDTKSIFHHLKALGYRVGLTGKTHIGPPAAFPYEDVGDQSGGAGGDDPDLPVVDFQAAEAFMRRDRSQPFFLVAASHNPHVPYTRGDPKRFDPARIHVPPYLVDTPATRRSLVQYYAEITALDEEVGRLMEIVERAGLAGDTLVLFTSEQGNAVPFAKWTLYDAGVRTELIVRWPGRVRPGATTDAMVSYADVTPTLVAAAGGRPPAVTDGRSFAPVLFGRAQSHRKYVYGIHTNLGIIGGEAYPIRSVRDDRYKLIRNLMADRPYRNLLNNTASGGGLIGDWRAAAAAGDAWAAKRLAAYERRPPVELYDVAADPFELRNVADDPALAGIRRSLELELDRWMTQQGDRGIEAERDAFRHINPALVRRLKLSDPSSISPASRRP